MKFLPFYAIAVLVLVSCASVGTPIAQQNVRNIKPGVTTEADLLRLFGNPNTKTLDSNGRVVMMWIYSAAQANAKSFIPLVGPFVGGTNVQVQQLTVLMRSDGKVDKYTMNNSNPDMHMGTPRQTP